MKSRNETRGGIYSITNWNANGSQNGQTQYIASTRSQDAFNVLSGGNVRGDFKRPNPNSFSRDVQNWMSGYYEETRSTDFPKRTRVQGDGIANSSFGTAGYSNDAYNQALSRLYDKYRNTADWSTTLLQGGQVASMVSSALDIVNYVRRFRARQLPHLYQEYLRWRRSGGRVSQLAADKWLEFQYGWKPLAQDIYSSAIELSKIYPSLMVIEARGSDNLTRGIDKASSIPGLRETGTEHVFRRCEIKCRFKPPASDAQLLSNFTSMNPFSIAWELTPFSFCVDWVYDVGGYLRAMESSCLSHNSFVDGYVTEGYKSETTNLIKGVSNNGNVPFTVADMKGSTHRAGKRRTVLSGSPFPRPPRFNFDLGSGRLMNAAALLTQFLHR